MGVTTQSKYIDLAKPKSGAPQLVWKLVTNENPTRM